MSFQFSKVRSLVWVAFAAAAIYLPSQAGAQTVYPSIEKLPGAIYLPEGRGATLEKEIKDLRILSQAPLVFSTDDTNVQLDAKIRTLFALNTKEFGLEGNAGTLAVKEIRPTLSGKLVVYEQTFNGVPIIDSQVVVAINLSGAIESIAKSIISLPTAKAASVPTEAKISEENAHDIAWQDLKASGKLLEAPSIQKAYFNEKNVLSLVYIVRVAVSEPFGYWEYYIDSVTGRIARKFDRRVQENGSKRAVAPNGQYVRASIAITDRRLAALRFNDQLQWGAGKLQQEKTEKLANGKGLVFDPNPMTALSDNTLKDDDAPERFSGAYTQVPLDELTEVEGRLHLRGSAVRIEDFEPGPNGRQQAPSTTVGEWTARRGNNAFNDVMTYFFLHKSISYLRQLGYSGTSELFPKGISADSDGVNGDDNSHYVPGSDRLAFGQGCVDDNEDADVILHELGHAITYHINPVWPRPGSTAVGDAGAIGEGFGDYWAVSYRMKLKNGMWGDPGKVFVWDGISSCWAGRRVDRDSAQYDPSKTYGAHVRMEGFVSDELWSTPLVKSLRELMAAGESAESVDKVVLEGMRGIGSSFTMRSLALATVAKAKTMFPGKPHATVFEKHFKHHKIVE